MVIFPAHLSYNLCALMYTNHNPCDPPCGIALSAELIAFGGGYGYRQTLLVSSCENVWELKIVLRYSDQYRFWQWKISITNLTKIEAHDRRLRNRFYPLTCPLIKVLLVLERGCCKCYLCAMLNTRLLRFKLEISSLDKGFDIMFNNWLIQRFRNIFYTLIQWLVT